MERQNSNQRQGNAGKLIAAAASGAVVVRIAMFLVSVAQRTIERSAFERDRTILETEISSLTSELKRTKEKN